MDDVRAIQKTSLYDTTLPTMAIPKEYECLNHVLGSGAEGTVFIYKGYAVKVFDHFDTFKKYSDKFAKIERLGLLRDPSFTFPIGLAGYESGLKKEGYYMDMVKVNRHCRKLSYIAALYDTRAILEVFRKADNVLKRAHEMGITIGDLRGDNVLIDENLNPIFCDTDNFAYDGYGYDLKVGLSSGLETTYGTAHSQVDNDKFLMGLLVMNYFLEGVDHDIYDYFSKDFFKLLIEHMHATPEFKDAMEELFSDSVDKPYIGPLLDMINPDEKMFTIEDIISVRKGMIKR